jgi:glutamate dehydrogenase
MTSEVAELVLRNNDLQTQAISMMEARAPERLDEQARLIQDLERTGLLDRELEFLPSEEVIQERRDHQQGLTRPEIAIILSYAKIDLYNGLIAAPKALDNFLAPALLNYFPSAIRQRYKDLIPGHRLSREILTTLIANSIVNRMGPAFVKRTQEDTNATISEIANAYIIALEICRAKDLWNRIESLDNQVPASAQHSMMFEVSRVLRHACYWLLERHGHDLAVEDLIHNLKSGLTDVSSKMSGVLPRTGKEIRNAAKDHYIANGAPETLAKRMAALTFTQQLLDITFIANSCKKAPRDVAKIYFDISEQLDTFWLGKSIESHEANDRWHALARTSLRDSLNGILRDLTTGMITRKKVLSPKLVLDWMAQNKTAIAKTRLIFDEIKERDKIDFATLSVAVQELRKLAIK